MSTESNTPLDLLMNYVKNVNDHQFPGEDQKRGCNFIEYCALWREKEGVDVHPVLSFRVTLSSDELKKALETEIEKQREGGNENPEAYCAWVIKNLDKYNGQLDSYEDADATHPFERPLFSLKWATMAEQLDTSTGKYNEINGNYRRNLQKHVLIGSAYAAALLLLDYGTLDIDPSKGPMTLRRHLGALLSQYAAMESVGQTLAKALTAVDPITGKKLNPRDKQQFFPLGQERNFSDTYKGIKELIAQGTKESVLKNLPLTDTPDGALVASNARDDRSRVGIALSKVLANNAKFYVADNQLEYPWRWDFSDSKANRARLVGKDWDIAWLTRGELLASWLIKGCIKDDRWMQSQLNDLMSGIKDLLQHVKGHQDFEKTIKGTTNEGPDPFGDGDTDERIKKLSRIFAAILRTCAWGPEGCTSLIRDPELMKDTERARAGGGICDGSVYPLSEMALRFEIYSAESKQRIPLKTCSLRAGRPLLFGKSPESSPAAKAYHYSETFGFGNAILEYIRGVGITSSELSGLSRAALLLERVPNGGVKVTVINKDGVFLVGQGSTPSMSKSAHKPQRRTFHLTTEKDEIFMPLLYLNADGQDTYDHAICVHLGI